MIENVQEKKHYWLLKQKYELFTQIQINTKDELYNSVNQLK